MSNVTCGVALELIHKRADARLLPPEAASLEGHLAACATCRTRASLLSGAASRLQRRLPLPAGFTDSVLRQARSQTPRGDSSSFRFPVAWALPMAAVLALALAVGSLWWLRPSAEHVAEAPQVQVELELLDDGARSVAVAGDFNEWNAAVMKRGEDGVWRVRLSLPPGRYQYVFVVDGEKWIADPHAATVVDSGYSGTNSVLDVSL